MLHPSIEWVAMACCPHLVSSAVLPLTGYKTNRYQLDQATIDKVTEKWSFAVKEWGYEAPQLKCSPMDGAPARSRQRRQDTGDP